MHSIKRIVATAGIALLFAAPALASAQATSLTDLQTQLSALMQQLSQLQTQALSSGPTPAVTTNPPAPMPAPTNNFTVTASTSPNLVITGINGPAQLQIEQNATWTVYANAATSTDPLRYSASWGDASSTAAQSSNTFTHTYTQANTYAPTFTVTDASSTDSATASVTAAVSDSETAPLAPSSCPNITSTLEIGMTDGQTGGQVTVLQNFLIAQGDLAAGDNSGYFGAATQVAVEQFQTANNIQAVGFVGPQTRTAINAMCTTPSNNSSFTATPTSGAAPLTVSFSANVNSGISDGPIYTINFGDGQSGQLKLNPAMQASSVTSHTYAQAGTYTAQLIQNNGCMVVGCTPAPSSVLGTVTITVGGSSQTSFTATPTSGSAPLTVQFSGSVPGTFYTLDFGDGTTPATEGENVDCVQSDPTCAQNATIAVNQTHTYATSSIYTALLENSSGAGVATTTISVLGGTKGGSCPNISTNVGPGSSGNVVQTLQQFLISLGLLPAGDNSGYFGSMTQSAVQSWQSQNGVVSSGSPSTTGFGAVGPRTRGAMQSRCGGGWNTPPVATSTPSTPQAVSFTASPLSGTAPFAVSFSVSGASGVSEIDFGDGSTTTVPSTQCTSASSSCALQSISHTYASAGIYTALLTQMTTPSCSGISYNPNDPLSFLSRGNSCLSQPTQTVLLGKLTITVSAPAATPTPTPAPSCSISVSPSSIVAGQNATLSWTWQNGTSISIAGVGNSGAQTSTTVSPSVTSTYAATVSGPGGQGTCSAVLQVAAAPETFSVGAACNGSFCAADQATANEYCVTQGFTSASTYLTYPVTESNPNNSSIFTGNEAWWNGSSWGYAWGGQCNIGEGCTPENANEIYQATCQNSAPASSAAASGAGSMISQ